MKHFCLLICVLGTLAVSLQAQVLNPGFENWTAGNPDNWYANNVPSVATPVTRVTSAHSGTYALRGDVATFNDPTPFAPLVQSGTNATGHTVSQRYATCTGYYQFTPVSGDKFSVNVVMYKSGNPIGVGAIAIGTTVSTYTQFSATINYTTAQVPDTCIVQISIIGPVTGSDFHVGSFMLVDDLVLSGTATSVEQTASSRLPEQFLLGQNYPNPFNPSTTIEFALPHSGFTSLKIYNALGTEVATLVSQELSQGQYRSVWNASGFPSGVYFYRIQSTNFSQTRTLVLVK